MEQKELNNLSAEELDAMADALLAADDAAQAAPADKPAADKPKQTQYDFYTLLPGEGVQMTDAELAASAKAEAVA